jgi:hypothetical protein
MIKRILFTTCALVAVLAIAACADDPPDPPWSPAYSIDGQGCIVMASDGSTTCSGDVTVPSPQISIATDAGWTLKSVSSYEPTAVVTR